MHVGKQQVNGYSKWWLLPSLVMVAVAGCKQPDAQNSNASGDNTAGNNATSSTATTGEASAAGKAKPYTGDDILIGEYGDLTGKTAQFGESTRDGVALAVEEVNAAGGVLGKKVRIQLEDNGGIPQQTSSVVRKLVYQNNVLAVLGEVASGRSIAGAKVCQPAGMPMISPTSTNPQVTQIGNYIFRTCFIDPFQGVACARFAKGTLKVKTAAVLTDTKNPYSIGLSQYFIEEFKKGGGQIVAQQNYKEGDENFRSQLAAIKTKNPQVLFIPGYYTEVGVIAKQARDLGITQPLLGGDGWESTQLTQIAGSAVQDCYFSTHAAPDSGEPRMTKFRAAFKKKYNVEPDALTAVAYDAANMLFAAIKKAGVTDRDKIRDAIAATQNFPGVTGNITIDEYRNAIKPLVMLRVQGDKFKYVTTIKP